MKKAVDIDGVDLISYCPWGCIDLVSAGTGEMEKRYGFIHVNKNNEGQGTLKRTKKKSFDWYKKVIATNGDRPQRVKENRSEARGGSVPIAAEQKKNADNQDRRWDVA